MKSSMKDYSRLPCRQALARKQRRQERTRARNEKAGRVMMVFGLVLAAGGATELNSIGAVLACGIFGVALILVGAMASFEPVRKVIELRDS